jgi:SAM-dependent methyltransferase
MILTKTIDEEDYKLINLEVKLLKDTQKILTEKGVRIDIGHEHRFWEYGMSLKALQDWMCDVSKTDNPKIIDVGAGLGLLGPSLSYGQNLSICEVEPNTSYKYDRSLCNAVLLDLKKPIITWTGGQSLDIFSSFHKATNYYDVVFCISVIEHVADDHAFLRKLSEIVAPGGLLFLTTDVMPVMPGKYHFDNLREHNYTMFDICKKIEYLRSIGFELLGESDLEYKGDKVFNYSFASIAMVRK